MKAQERSKPRATSSAKRPRPNEDGIDPVTNKKVKAEIAGPISSSVTDDTGFEGDQITTPYLSSSSTRILDEEQHQQQQHYKHDHEGLSTVQSPPIERADQRADMEVEGIAYNMSPDAKIPTDTGTIVTLQAQAHNQTANPLVSPPTSLVGETEVLPPEHPSEELHGGSVIVDGENEVLHTPTSGSRHSSRQPRQIDRYAPEQQVVTKPSTATPKQTVPTAPSRQTMKSSSTKKSTSRPGSSHTKKSASPSVEKRLTVSSTTSPSSSKKVKRERTSFSADDTADADAESLRLIRELQEQDFGLRRRAARV